MIQDDIYCSILSDLYQMLWVLWDLWVYVVQLLEGACLLEGVEQGHVPGLIKLLVLDDVTLLA